MNNREGIMSQPMWIKITFGKKKYKLLNLDHPQVDKAILQEVKSGVDVYYDQRWGLTQEFCRFIYEIPELFINKNVLIVGAGIGAETVVIGSMAKKLYINDLAPVALDYCARQLMENKINNFEIIPGSYGSVDFPVVDLAVACFCVYTTETMRTMKSFIEKSKSPILIINETLPNFVRLLKTVKRKKKLMVSEERFPCYLYV
jgi:predicted nicotinamide N-methyase